MNPTEFPPDLILLALALESFPALGVTAGRVEGSRWFITLNAEPGEEGWRSLEFVAWAITDMKRGGFPIAIEAASPPPYLNTPGRMLYFVLSGSGDKTKDSEAAGPSRIAALLNEWRSEYVAVGEEE